MENIILPIVIVVLGIFLLKRKLRAQASNFIVLTITPGLDPELLESEYEKPLNKFLEEHKLGKVAGSGTMYNPDKSINFSNIEISTNSRIKENISSIVEGLKRNGFTENTQIQLWDSPDLIFPDISSLENYLNKN